MTRLSRATGVGKLVQLGRTDSPIASGLSGHDVEVKVRHFLTAVHTVVLKPARNDTALTDLELHRSNDGNRELRLCDDRNVASARQRFADFTGLLPR
jgi:hypothetical protein